MSKSSNTFASRISRLAVATMALTVALWLVFDLLERVWGWLALMAFLVAAVVIVVRALRARRDRW